MNDKIKDLGPRMTMDHLTTAHLENRMRKDSVRQDLTTTHLQKKLQEAAKEKPSQTKKDQK